MITLRLRSTEPTLRIRASQVIPTPELQAAISGAQSAQTAAEAAQAAAETAETNAETAATNAASSASSASTSASNASSSASSASSSASGASTSAMNAGNSASAAATSASNAASSASSASSSASSAAASAADAAMSADSFDDVWLGTKTSDPTVDNDGNPLATGQLYFNVISNTLKIYNGTAWQSYTAASGLSAVVDDTAPSLGGNLSLNGHNITAAGTEKVDGRDVSVDGAKLDTIASNADVTSATNVGSSIHGATAKTTPVDADETALIDSAASNVLKKVTWANVKATLKTYNDGLYAILGRAISAGSGLTGGGDLSADRTISLSINGQTTDGSPDVTADYVITYDASASGFKKVLLNLLGDTVNNIKKNVSATLTVGYIATPYSAGTKSSGTFTPDPANGNQQYATNGGAHTLAPPSSACSMIIEYVNNGSAGTITTSGFTKVTGDTLNTTNGNKFLFFIVKSQNYSHLYVQALQ